MPVWIPLRQSMFIIAHEYISLQCWLCSQQWPKLVYVIIYIPILNVLAVRSGHAAWDMISLFPLQHWDRWFESHSRNECLHSVLLRFALFCVGSGLSSGWSPFQMSTTGSVQIKKLKWNEAFHGCPMLREGATRIDRQTDRQIDR
jgi:hypothetical protein